MMILAAILLLALVSGVIGLWIRRTLMLSEQRMKTSFQSLSYEIMERSSRSFLDLARASFENTQEGAKRDLEGKHKSLETLLEPIRESMKMLDQHQRQLEQRREGAYASLSKQIESMMQSEQQLRKETATLSAALRSPPARGAWGQVHLKRVVELAGLLNQCDFAEQVTLESEGKILRPDLVIHLPGQRQIVVDAKTPLMAHLEAAEAPDESQRRRLLETHATHLRKHMRDLSQKDYWKRFDLTPEFVILFLPAESFFSSALQIDPTLIEAGAEKNIIVATPTTLIAILRAVAQSWKQEAISKNAEQIARLGQDLYERLCVLSEHWTKVGKSLTSSVEAYNQAISSLESRVLVSARKLKDHGAAPLSKELLTLEPIDKITRELISESR